MPPWEVVVAAVHPMVEAVVGATSNWVAAAVATAHPRVAVEVEDLALVEEAAEVLPRAVVEGLARVVPPWVGVVVEVAASTMTAAAAVVVDAAFLLASVARYGRCWPVRVLSDAQPCFLVGLPKIRGTGERPPGRPVK